MKKQLDLKELIQDKEQKIKVLKNADGILGKLVDQSGKTQLANELIENKLISSEIISVIPEEITQACIKQGFNPGTQLILELCEFSKNSAMDKSLSELIKHFSTNKYDAGFVKSVVNLSTSNHLYKVCATLVELSPTPSLLIEDIKKSSFKTYIEMIYLLPDRLYRMASDFMSILCDDDMKSLEKFSDKELLKLLDKPELSDSIISANVSSATSLYHRYLELAKLSTTSDEHFLIIVELRPKILHGYHGYIPYRKCAEETSNIGYVSDLLKDVPLGSKHFARAFVNGNAQPIEAKYAYQLLKERITMVRGRHGSYSDFFLKKVLECGSDSEMAKLIETDSSTLLDHIHAFTPGTLSRQIPKDRKKVAEAIYNIVKAPYKKAISEVFPELKAASRNASISEIHDALFDLMKGPNGQEFLASVAKYDGANGLNDGLKKFVARHGQATYQKKYESYIREDFLISLNNEDVFMFLFNSKCFKFYARIPHEEKISVKGGYLSLKNALLVLNTGKEDLAFCLCSKKDRPELIGHFNLNQLNALNGLKDYRKYVVAQYIKEAANGGRDGSGRFCNIKIIAPIATTTSAAFAPRVIRLTKNKVCICKKILFITTSRVS